MSNRLGKILAITISALAVVIIAIILINTGSDNNTEIVGENNTVPSKGSNLVIQISEITEKARFYPVEVGGTKLEVIAVKASDNAIRTSFNTCQVCYSSGRGYYKQEGDVLVCQNCGNRFGMDDVGVTKGGCNPVPITEENRTATDTEIIISKEFLAQAKEIFANWKY
ncbi:MAG: DUF2318 domain-containing protein [Monoglobales bacterium]